MRSRTISEDEISRINPNFNYNFEKKSFRDRFHIPYFNIIKVLYSYASHYICRDISSSLIIAMVLIPQSIADASIIGLEPKYGLYTSIIPLITYSVFGTSKELAVGPVALLSILLSSSGLSLEEIFLVSLLSGTIQIILSVIKLGTLINFFSHSMIKGVVMASSIIISTSQLYSLTGIEKITEKNFWVLIYSIIDKYDEFHIPTLITSFLNLVFLYILNRCKSIYNLKNMPIPLILLIVNIIVFYIFELNIIYNIKVLGDFDFPFPKVHLPHISLLVDNYNVISQSFLIAFISFIESITISKSLANDNGYKIDNNQELFSMGIMNICGSFFQCFASTGSFSRSIISNSNNTKSQLSGLFTSIIILLFSLFLRPTLFYLPRSVISCVIINSCIKLCDIRTPVYFWKINKYDFIVWFVAFTMSITFGFQYGIITGLLISVLLLISNITSPHWARLGQLREKGIGCQVTYRNLKRYKDAVKLNGIEIMRFDSCLNFANIDYFREIISELSKYDTKNIILDFSVISSLDSTAIHGINEMYDELQNTNIYFVSVRGPVRDIMNKSGIYKLYTKRRFYNEIHDAVTYINIQDL